MTHDELMQIANLEGSHIADFCAHRTIKALAKSRTNMTTVTLKSGKTKEQGIPTPENLKTIHKYSERIVMVGGSYEDHTNARAKKVGAEPIKADANRYEPIGNGRVALRNPKSGKEYLVVYPNLPHTFDNYRKTIYTDANGNVVTYDEIREYLPAGELYENQGSKKQEEAGIAKEDQVAYRTYSRENVVKFKTTITEGQGEDKKVVAEYNFSEMTEELRGWLNDNK